MVKVVHATTATTESPPMGATMSKKKSGTEPISIVRGESPFAPSTKRIKDTANPPAHTYGAASMQTYADGQVAYNTHASADGFLAYVNQFEQTSFRVKDGQVEWWQYSPSYDDWQDNYGCDSVEVFYHAGHGGTDPSTGNYSAPLGTTWGGQSFLNSTQMSIGDQRLRYLFLATCEGCMVFAPNNPIRTWNVPNRGMRMLFGATANIYDDPNYGTNFWNHWKTGESFSQAWQDCVLDAGSSQQPSSTACGTSADDAKNRLFNERFFDSGTASRNWYWWRWVGAAPAGTAGPAQKVPRKLRFARVVPRPPGRHRILRALQEYGFDLTSVLPDDPLEGLRVTTPAGRFGVLPGGGVVVEHQKVPLRKSTLSEKQVAETCLEALGGARADMRLMRVLPSWHAGASAKDGKYEVRAEIFEHVAIYRQIVAGLPVLTPGVGEVRMHVDASGKVRRVIDTRLEVVDVRDSGPWPVLLPTPKGGQVRARQLTTIKEVMEALERAAHSGPRVRESARKGSFSRIVPGSLEFGFALRGTDLVPVARATVEFGNERYRMLKAVEVDLIA
jgi:hypothetical protein